MQQPAGRCANESPPAGGEAPTKYITEYLATLLVCTEYTQVGGASLMQSSDTARKAVGKMPHHRFAFPHDLCLVKLPHRRFLHLSCAVTLLSVRWTKKISQR